MEVTKEAVQTFARMYYVFGQCSEQEAPGSEFDEWQDTDVESIWAMFEAVMNDDQEEVDRLLHLTAN